MGSGEAGRSQAAGETGEPLTRSDLILLAEYDRWATGRLLSLAERLPAGSWTQPGAGNGPALRQQLVHLVSAALVWLARWHARPAPGGLRAAAFGEPAALRRRWEEVSLQVTTFLAGVEEAHLAECVEYRTSTGRWRRQRLEQTVMHLFLHAAYHRGQVALTLRQLGQRAVHTDLLHFSHLRGGGQV